jgi:four helix bundle protein
MSQESGDKKVSIKSFTDLVAWQKSHSLVVDIYRVTRDFPKDEVFALTSQIRRAVVSISSNIAEGFSRRTKADRSHFYEMARASLTEVQSQLLIARDVGYLSRDAFSPIADQSVECHKLLTGLIKSTKGLAS